MRYKDSEHKLSHAKKLFEDAVDHTERAHLEAHRAERFYHNTDCEGQWEEDDLAYLRDNERVAFSFNIIKGKLDTFLGMYADAQRTPVVASSGSGPSADLLAEVVDAVKDQVLQDAGYQRLAARQLKTGTITGECSLHVEVEPSQDGEGWIKVNIYRILPFELHWDVSSIEPDRGDARYVFWDRWLTKDEFEFSYPDHADKWDALSDSGSDSDEYSMDSDGEFGGEFGFDDTRNDYNQDKFNRYYYDRHKGKIRVIRYEYKAHKTTYFMLDGESGEKIEIEKDQVKRVKEAVAIGAPVNLIEEEREIVEVCEFVGDTLLAEYDEAGPFKGFSIVPYCYDVDEETGTAYGPIRNLFDPQMELNKSASLEIEYMAQATAPGVTAEEDTISDEEAFSAQRRLAGGISLVKKDALVEGRVQERPTSQPSAAVMARKQGAMELLSEISAIPSVSNLTAAEHMQSGVTVAIRYNKSRQTVSDPFAHFEGAQKLIVEKVVEAITSSMPDDQIAAILGKNGRFQVEQGMVIEMGENPRSGQGQPQGMPGMPGMPQQPEMVPQARAQLRDLRGMKWSLDLEYTSENSTLRMMELEILMQLVGAGVDVDPEVLVERATNSRSVRERLKTYVEKAQQARAEGQQAQAAMMEKQNQQFAQIEMAKATETKRHNTMTEMSTLNDQQIKERLKHLEIWEKADETEKVRLFNMAKFAVQQTDQRAQQAQQLPQGAPLNG